MLTEKWMVYAKRADFQALGERLQVDPVIARIMVNRDVATEPEMEQFLHPHLSDLGDEKLLKGMAEAVSLLHTAITAGKKIRIIGDYDVDGIQSTYILKTALKRCGARVDYAIPDRIEDGYGMNPILVQRAAEDGCEVILTCDNGIAAMDAVETALEYGMTVIVTDHHEIPFSETEEGRKYLLPKAHAIINPKQPGCVYPSKNICGAVVAWKLVFGLYEAFGIPRQEAYDFLENAAFATVADVMELQGENRIIVSEGLKALEHTKNTGMATLLERCDLSGKPLSAYHVGFVLGPCFNASGRLDTAARAIELLEEKDPARAAAIAGELQTLNEERKAMTQTGVADAEAQIAAEGMEKDTVLVIYLPSLHESLAGIVAGRIKEKYYRPVFVLTDAKEGVKGSGRSIPGYSMYEKLCECRDLLDKFGGHPMAAGVSLAAENVSGFRCMLNEKARLTKDQLIPKVMIDVPMPVSYLTEDLVEQLGLLEPFGCGNPKPVFAQKGMRVLRAAMIGKQKNFLKLTLEGDGRPMDALYFGDGAAFAEDMKEWFGRDAWQAALSGRPSPVTVSVTYYPQINEFRGKRTLQIVITGYCKS